MSVFIQTHVATKPHEPSPPEVQAPDEQVPIDTQNPQTDPDPQTNTQLDPLTPTDSPQTVTTAPQASQPSIHSTHSVHSPQATGNSSYKEDTDSITTQPKSQAPMSFSPQPDVGSFNVRSSYSLSEVGSGYETNTNECAEFCVDFCSCFGVLDACCPADSDGCVSSFAIFCGNILFSCCKCK